MSIPETYSIRVPVTQYHESAPSTDTCPLGQPLVARDSANSKPKAITDMMISAMTTRPTLLTATILAALCIATSAVAQQSSATAPRSFYDRNGAYAGSTTRNPDSSRSSTFTDRNGSFAGSERRNSDGSTSYYDRNGHFTGSARSR
jgi:hypothetical protein